MAITFLDEEEDIVAAAEPPKVEGGITFLDEEEPAVPAVEPAQEPATPVPVEAPKITFLDEEPEAPSIGGLAVPPAPEIPKFEATKPSEGVLRQAADLPVQFAIGINNSVKGLSDLFGADNPVSQNLAQNTDWYRGLLSAASKQDEQEVGRILQEAEGKGILDQLGAGLEAFSVAPADFVASGLGSLAVFAAGGLAGRAAGLGAKGIQAVQAGLGAGMGAGVAKGEIYQSVKDEMLAQGKTEEEAKGIAMDAQSFGGKNLDQILLGAGLGTIDALTGAEKIIGKVLAKGGLKPDASRIGNIIKNGITEAAPEFIQAAQEKFASNLALQREGVDVSLTQGVFSQGALEGLVGLGMGVGAGAIEPRIQTEPTKEEVSAAASETQDVARRSMDVAPATASLVEGEAEQIIQSQAETPEQRVARLQREAQEAAGEIELEEEVPVSGLPPVEPVTPPVTPTPEAAVAPVEPVVPVEGAVEPTVTEVAPEAVVEPTPVAPPVTPQLEPLRRVVKAEQTEDDVSGLVGQGLVELYKGQPVITQAGLETLPEAERPRLTPEARKIQIDTRTSEAAAEAISKNLRIGVDQVPVDVRMPAGWTIEGDIYIPPVVEAAPTPQPEARESRRAIATPQQDRDYLDAVERGDLDAASRLVDEAARAVGFDPEMNYTYFRGVSKQDMEKISKSKRLLPSLDLIPFDNEVLEYAIGEEYSEMSESQIDEAIKDLISWYDGSMKSVKNGVNLTTDFQNAAGYGDFVIATNGTGGEIADVSDAHSFAKNAKDIEVSAIYDVKKDKWITLSDPVTYDDQGNIIPPSQRFQQGEADIRYARRQLRELFRAGRPIDDYEGRAPSVNWDAVDMYGVKWDEKTVGEFVDSPHNFIYSAMLDSGDLTPKVVEMETANEIERMNEDQIRSEYPDEFFDEDVDWREVRSRMAEESRNSWEYSKQDMANPTGRGYPPALVRRTGENTFEVVDGNHRIDLWQEQGLNVIPVWVIDDYLFREDKKRKTPLDTSAYNAEEKQKIRSFLEFLSQRQSNEGVDPNQFMASYRSLPEEFKRAIEYTGRSTLYRGTDSDTEGKTLFPEAMTFTRNEGYAKFMGTFQITNKGLPSTGTIDSEKVVQMLNRRANKKFEKDFRDAGWNIGDDEGEVIVLNDPRERIRQARRASQPTVGMTTDAVRARLGALGFGVEGMIRIVEDPQAAFEGRTIIQDGKAVRIELNASALNDDAAIDRVLNHEFAEAANADGALNKLVERLTPKEKKEINDAITRLGYEERVRTTEEAARAIETLAAGWKGRGFFERAVARVEAWGSKLGLKLTRRAAEYIAARNLSDINAGFKAAYEQSINVTTESREARREPAPEDRVTIQLKGRPDPEIGQRVSIKDREGKEIGNIFFKERAYLSGSGFPLVNEFHIGLKRKYQRMGYFADAVKSLLRESPNPVFIVSSRVVNNNVFKAIDNLDRSVFDVKELDRGFLITLKPEVAQQDRESRIQMPRPAGGPRVEIRESRREPAPTFTEESPEAKTLSNLKASMEKVDAASETKGGKPETQKVSEIAANWMEQGGDERALQDAIVENTNLTPANAARVAKAIARQYDIQQSIATAFLETQTGLSVEALPEGVTLPKEVDPDRPKPVMQRLFDVFMGVRVPPVKIEVNEKTALKQQIRLKAAANRAAKAEQKRTAEEVVEIIKAMELLGPVRPKQVQALAKRAARVIWTNEKSVEAFSEYAAKVVENANYDADLREAKDAQKRAKQLSTQKKVAMGPQREVLEDVSKIPVNKLDDPRMFAEAVNYYLRGFKAVLSPDYVVIPDAEMESYLSGAQSETQRNQRDLDRESNQRLAEKYGIDPDQVNQMMESIDIIKQIEAQENRDALENLLTEKAVETQQGLRGYDTDNLRADQRSIVSSMLKVDPKALDPEERQRFIRITNNIIYNNQTNGAEYFVAVAKGQQSAREAAQDSTMVAKNRAWINLLPRFISERMQRGWALELQSVADTFRNAFGKGAMAKMYDAMGMLDLNLGFTKANNVIDEIQEKIAEFHRNLEKKYKAAARNQDGLLAEGVVGFLIQSVPKKDEVSSINQRRDLIRQDIANRKGATGEPDRVAMAGRIEAILNQIDGDSVEAILNNMKREFPANHESLVWYKDTLLPQYKDFLKSFDENFNDQANNYENPNYLTIGFTSAGPSLAITPEEQSLFYDQVSLRPKQSAYTIKRVDYTKIPDGKEIEFNLRRNVFNGLSDQINKAYTSSGWQRIASFMKTPEAEIVFGGAANKDFFIERLNRLRLSRMRRGSMGSGGAIEKAVDSLSVISRKLGTGIALGGVYQWIKQPPDQLITALGSGGRYDLLAKNIAPSTQKAARELLNKFSIGRRGDASSGYKYINQMEGHQNRLERYFSESKWDQAKEQAGKIADVWMVALKSSDFLAASAAWMTYYEGELNKQDIKIDDWSKEAELIDSDPARRQAAAFAEQMTDIYQGSSDPTSMATFAQSGKTGWENLVKAIFVPFNSFAIQQRMRLYSDARDAINGSKGGAGGLAGTIGGLILFHTTKRYVIPAISGAGIGILYGLMGVDMEEPDEEKQKEEANKNWRQFLADITGNLLVGGTPQIVESQFIDAMNRASYLVSLQLENDSILNDEGEIMSYDQYSKERSPFYRYKSFDNAMSLGMLEIGLGQAEQVALQTKMLATPEEMEMYTPEEQRLLYFSALSEWMYLMRLNDADFARLVNKSRRDMMKAAKEREKELQRIRSGR